MATAKETAQAQLGALDLGYLDKERQAAQQGYGTSKSSLETNFNNLLQQINTNRDLTKMSFNKGRSTVAENAFTQNRMNLADVGSRVVGKSGLKELGEVGTRMETGRQYSDLANTYYSGMKDLANTETQGRSQFDLSQRALDDQLAMTMAGIDTRASEASRAYNMSLAQLAEQIQSRWDQNANAKAAMAQAASAAAAQTAALRKSAQDQVKAAKQEFLQNIAMQVDPKTGKSVSPTVMAEQIRQYFGTDYTTAYQVARELTMDDTSRNALGQRGLSTNWQINKLLGL